MTVAPQPALTPRERKPQSIAMIFRPRRATHYATGRHRESVRIQPPVWAGCVGTRGVLCPATIAAALATEGTNLSRRYGRKRGPPHALNLARLGELSHSSLELAEPLMRRTIQSLERRHAASEADHASKALTPIRNKNGGDQVPAASWRTHRARVRRKQGEVVH